jgi:xanthine/uracil permease
MAIMLRIFVQPRNHELPIRLGRAHWRVAVASKFYQQIGCADHCAARKATCGMACFGIAARGLITPLCGQFISFLTVRKFFPERLRFSQGESGKFWKSLAILADN